MIHAVEASVADLVIVPLQDVLGLGSSARMNLPGTVSGNWKWRYRPGVLSRELCARLRSMTALYDRTSGSPISTDENRHR
jgi:4-alpha-glucanotransferase